MDAVARRYGYDPNRAGCISCPFHHEKTPSLKIYTSPGRGFYCYGCGAGGSVIDFVMMTLNISYQAAVVRINADFGLGMTAEKPNPSELRKWRQEQAEKLRGRQLYEAEYTAMTSAFRRLWFAFKEKSPATLDGPIDPEWIEACHRLPVLQHWFDEHPYER